MSSYRDDLKAARSRISLLESELEEAEEEIGALLGPSAAAARRDTLRSKRRRWNDDDLERGSVALAELQEQDAQHYSRLQLFACLSIALVVIALAAGTFVTILALINYVAE